MIESELNLGEIITWCQNWLINTSKATNTKDFDVLGRAVLGCFKIYIDDGIHNGYDEDRRMSNTDWQAYRLIDEAIKEYLLK